MNAHFNHQKRAVTPHHNTANSKNHMASIQLEAFNDHTEALRISKAGGRQGSKQKRDTYMGAQIASRRKSRSPATMQRVLLSTLNVKVHKADWLLLVDTIERVDSPARGRGRFTPHRPIFATQKNFGEIWFHEKGVHQRVDITSVHLMLEATTHLSLPTLFWLSQQNLLSQPAMYWN